MRLSMEDFQSLGEKDSFMRLSMEDFQSLSIGDSFEPLDGRPQNQKGGLPPLLHCLPVLPRYRINSNRRL